MVGRYVCFCQPPLRRLRGVADQAVGPEVHHVDFELVAGRFDGICDLHSPRGRPDDAEVVAVQPDARDLVHSSEIEIESSA